jgi:hypothetical protein
VGDSVLLSPTQPAIHQKEALNKKLCLLVVRYIPFFCTICQANRTAEETELLNHRIVYS